MTRIILFDRELHEALTVIDFPSSTLRKIEEGFLPPVWRLLIETPYKIEFSDPIPSESMDYNVVDIKLEHVRRGRDPKPIFWYGYPDNPTLALRLRAAFLPGQLGEVERLREEAYWRGMFIESFNR